ncbi:MAG: hypothetical protein D6675_09355 [Gemmatimonadetes bacterium]|nr:MAG: hypothetical protein D6675_09355 [Gemmatimonadota bacterium]
MKLWHIFAGAGILLTWLLVSCSGDEGSEPPRSAITGHIQLEGIAAQSDVEVILRTASDSLVAQQTTPATGEFEFTGLTSGTYRLEIASNRESHENRRLENISVNVGQITHVGDLLLRQYTPIDDHLITHTTWTAAESPYRIDRRIKIEPGVILTLLPGAEIQFTAFGELNILGTLTAIGTRTQPIVFTSTALRPAANAWRGIYAASPAVNSRLEYTIVEYAKNAINSDFAGIDLFHSTLRYSDKGIFSESISRQQIVGNRIEANRIGVQTDMVSNIVITDNQFDNATNLFLEHSGARIEHNQFQGEQGIHVRAIREAAVTIIANQFVVNDKAIWCTVDSYPEVHQNNFLQGTYWIYSDFFYGQTTHGIDAYQEERDINATNNWWGTTRLADIRTKIWDEHNNTGQYGDQTFSYVQIEPVLLTANSDAGPR